jgi:L-serine dehydratase
MGPMRAALRFAKHLEKSNLLHRTTRIETEMYGSLALTGLGHRTDCAVVLGLLGEEPSLVIPATIYEKLNQVRECEELRLVGIKTVRFREDADLIFRRDQAYPPGARLRHPNGLRFTAYDGQGAIVDRRIYFSVGGGFIVEDGEVADVPVLAPSNGDLPHAFCSAAELLDITERSGITICELMLRNESALKNNSEIAVRTGILHIWKVMQECVKRGIATEGILPGGLNVRRRAHRLAERLKEKGAVRQGAGDPLAPLDWVTVYAMAVNEENAAGGRVVTAPTNGAAGVVPAVALYYRNFVTGSDEEGIFRYFLASAAIGILYKENASISGAEVGCQGEVGVACSMAASGLVAALEGSNAQIEHAAEIAMEHNLGMTCDPIGGLVQIPCIERNAMGAVKAVHASRMALNETEGHKVSLDQVIKTMYQTGLDMQSRYKETSLAGLALNVIEC